MIFEFDPRAKSFELFAFLTIKPRKRLDARLRREASLTFPQFGALYAISAQGPSSQKALAAVLETDANTTMVICESLARKGFIARATSDSDRRSYSLSATRAGRAALKRAMPIAAAVYGPMLDALTEEDQRLLYPILEKLRAALAAAERKGRAR